MTHPHLWPPPLLVILVPANRPAESLLEREARLPAEQALDLRRVAGMTKDLPGTVADKLYLAIGWPHRLKHGLGHFQHAAVMARPDIDDLSLDLLKVCVQQLIQRLAMLFNEDPVARRRAVAVHRQRFFEDTTGDETRHGLLQMLVWAIVVEGAH